MSVTVRCEGRSCERGTAVFVRSSDQGAGTTQRGVDHSSLYYLDTLGPGLSSLLYYEASVHRLRLRRFLRIRFEIVDFVLGIQ